MKRPKFVQISTVSPMPNSVVVYALDEEGGVWMYNGKEWVTLEEYDAQKSGAGTEES